MIWVKICGVRDAATAFQVATCRPDAIGLNFYPRSSRAVSADVAASIVRGLPDDIEPVGVFVNATATDVAGLTARCGLRRVQFHGDEPASLLAEFHRLSPAIPIVRAWRCGRDGLLPLRQYLAECTRQGAPVAAVLLDASVPGAYGGTGAVLPWSQLRSESAALPAPVILAGGLTADNVSAAIRELQPWGVDVASGVETSPGVKDPELVARFIAAARTATA